MWKIERALLRGLPRGVKFELVMPVHAEEAAKLLVDFNLVGLEGKRLAVDGQVALRGVRLHPVRVGLEVVLLPVGPRNVSHRRNMWTCRKGARTVSIQKVSPRSAPSIAFAILMRGSCAEEGMGVRLRLEGKGDVGRAVRTCSCRTTSMKPSDGSETGNCMKSRATWGPLPAKTYIRGLSNVTQPSLLAFGPVCTSSGRPDVASPAAGCALPFAACPREWAASMSSIILFLSLCATLMETFTLHGLCLSTGEESGSARAGAGCHNCLTCVDVAENEATKARIQYRMQEVVTLDILVTQESQALRAQVKVCHHTCSLAHERDGSLATLDK